MAFAQGYSSPPKLVAIPRVAVDLSVDSHNGVESLKVVRGALQRSPQLRPLILTLKCFLKQVPGTARLRDTLR